MFYISNKISMNAKCFIFVNIGKEMGKDKSENSGIQECKGSETIGPETDLAVVLNAWYSAGFHTGRQEYMIFSSHVIHFLGNLIVVVFLVPCSLCLIHIGSSLPCIWM